MKRNIINTLWGLILGSALLFGGCDEPEEVITPDFPEKISANVAAGEQFEFTIAPNMQWTLKISTEATTHFNFVVGENALYTLHGNAGEHTIVVAVSESEEFDNVRVCEIEMTMGGESHVVAVLTRGSKEREINLYVADFDDKEQTFVMTEDNEWQYGTTPVEEIEWVWSNEQWMQRYLVDANFNWVMGANTPAWLLTNETSGKVGQTELFFRVNREYLPLEDVECKIDFCDSADRNGDGTVSEDEIRIVGSYKTTMEGCKNICEVSIERNATFNADGMYYQSASDSYIDTLTCRINSPRGAEVFAAVQKEDGSYTTEGAEWIVVEIEEFPTEAGNEGVWERIMKVATAVYTETSERKGAIVALPKPVAESGNAALEEYIVCNITQEGVVIEEDFSNEAIMAYDDELMLAYASKFEKLESNVWPWQGAWASIPYAYKLTYRDNYSGDNVIFNKPFSRYVVYGYDGLSSGKYDNESCWVTIEERELTDEEGNVVNNAFHIRSRLGERVNPEDSEDNRVFENAMPGKNGGNRAVFVFYNEENSPYALLYFVLDPEFSPYTGVEGDVTFVDPEVALRCGATLAQIVRGDEYFSEEDDYVGTLQYLLTLTSRGQTIDLMVPSYGYSWSYHSWIMIPEWNPDVTNNTTTTITIDPASLPAADSGHKDVIGENTYKGIVSFYSSMSSTTPSLQLHVIYKAK